MTITYDAVYYRTIWQRILQRYTIASPVRDLGDLTRTEIVTRLVQHYVIPEVQQDHLIVHDYGAGNWLYLGSLLQACTHLPTSCSIQFTGIDYSEEALTFGIARVPQQSRSRIDIQTQVNDIASVLAAQASESIDCLISLETLEHLPADQEIFRHYARIVRPGGYLIISVPNKQPFLWSKSWWQYVFARQVFTEKDRRVGHLRRYRIDDLMALSQGCAVTVCHIEPYGFFFSDYLKALLTFLEKRGPRIGNWLFPWAVRLLFLEHRWWICVRRMHSEGFFIVFKKEA